jgi:hypothetical protein
MFENSCSNIGLKNILPITKCLASKKDVCCMQPKKVLYLRTFGALGQGQTLDV